MKSLQRLTLGYLYELTAEGISDLQRDLENENVNDVNDVIYSLELIKQNLVEFKKELKKVFEQRGISLDHES